MQVRKRIWLMAVLVWAVGAAWATTAHATPATGAAEEAATLPTLPHVSGSAQTRLQWMLAVVDQEFAFLAPYKQCLVDVVHRYNLAPELMLAILATEGGRPGMAMLNTNGTHDFGPMQVNTIWVGELKNRLGIDVSADDIQNNACMNLHVGGWILADELSKADEFWTGVGNYHSRTPKYHNRYIRRVYNNWNRLVTSYRK